MTLLSGLELSIFSVSGTTGTVLIVYWQSIFSVSGNTGTVLIVYWQSIFSVSGTTGTVLIVYWQSTACQMWLCYNQFLSFVPLKVFQFVLCVEGTRLLMVYSLTQYTHCNKTFIALNVVYGLTVHASYHRIL